MKAKPRLGGRTKACVACKQVLPLASFPPVKLHHRSRICDTCQAAGEAETPGGKRPRRGPEQREAINTRIAAGEDRERLAFEYGIAVSTIHTYAAQLLRASAPPKYEGEPAARRDTSMLSLDHTPRADAPLLAHTQTARVAAVVQRQGVRLSPAIAGYLAAFGVR